MICTQNDEFTENQFDVGQARWVATLLNGIDVIQDDGRPGCHPASAWSRLKQYLADTGLIIQKLRLEFRDHIVQPVPDNCDGYFFAKSAVGFYGMGTLHFYLLGYLQNNELKVQRWKVPELLPLEIESRPVESATESIIKRG